MFDSLVLKHAGFGVAPQTTDYQHTDATEQVYLMIGGMMLGHAFAGDSTLPRANALSQVHTYMEFADPTHSAAFVIDHDSGELVERPSYQAYGAPESDFRPARWDSFREGRRYAGHGDNAEVGVVYFGARYYSPQLARWISPDPLTVHGRGGDLNPYAYVHGSPVGKYDPIGLQEAGDFRNCVGICIPISGMGGGGGGGKPDNGQNGGGGTNYDRRGPAPTYGAAPPGTQNAPYQNADAPDEGSSNRASSAGVDTGSGSVLEPWTFGQVPELFPPPTITSAAGVVSTGGGFYIPQSSFERWALSSTRSGTYWDRVYSDFASTNRMLYGLAAPPGTGIGVGVLTGTSPNAVVAGWLGVPTLGEVGGSVAGGAAYFGAMGLSPLAGGAVGVEVVGGWTAVGLAGLGAGATAVVIGISYEVGVGAGSVLTGALP